MQNTSPLTTQSLFVIITGAVNAGKSFQLLSILDAEVDGQSVATPTLFLVAESSSEGTIGAILNDPSRACVWPVKDCEDATRALTACFPRSGPVTLGDAKRLWYAQACKTVADDQAAAVKAATDSKQPHPAPLPLPVPPVASPNDRVLLRSAVIDTMTTLYRGSTMTAKRLYETEAAKKNKGLPVETVNKKEDPSLNDMNLHQYAARVCGLLIDRLNAVTAHRGTMVFVTVHTCPAHVHVQGAAGEPTIKMTVGETPNLGANAPVKLGLSVPSFSQTWNNLAAKANIVVHSFAAIPEYGTTTLESINSDKAPSVVYGIITDRGVDYPKIGSVLWAKRQDGDGPWAYLSQMPRYWHPAAKCDDVIKERVSETPNLGAMLRFSIQQYVAAQAKVARAHQS